jgi:hypothetical protein
MLDGLTSNAVVCPGYFRFGGFSAIAASHHLLIPDIQQWQLSAMLNWHFRR